MYIRIAILHNVIIMIYKAILLVLKTRQTIRFGWLHRDDYAKLQSTAEEEKQEHKPPPFRLLRKVPCCL